MGRGFEAGVLNVFSGKNVLVYIGGGSGRFRWTRSTVARGRFWLRFVGWGYIVVVVVKEGGEGKRLDFGVVRVGGELFF